MKKTPRRRNILVFIAVTREKKILALMARDYSQIAKRVEVVKFPFLQLNSSKPPVHGPHRIPALSSILTPTVIFFFLRLALFLALFYPRPRC